MNEAQRILATALNELTQDVIDGKVMAVAISAVRADGTIHRHVQTTQAVCPGRPEVTFLETSSIEMIARPFASCPVTTRLT